MLSKLTESFISHNVFLKKYLSRYVKAHSDIDDLLQEVYINAFKAEQIKEIEKPKAFLFRIARNIALNELKKKSTQMTSFIEECQSEVVVETTASLEVDLSAEQSLELYCQAVDNLPNKCKKVYMLCKVHGWTHKEVAEELDITLSCVEKHLRSGLLRCRKYIKEANTRDETPGQSGTVYTQISSKQVKGF